MLNIVKNKKSVEQLFKYALVGIVSNASSYLAYLLITYLGGAPKLTMSVLYLCAAVVSYTANRRLTFMHKGGVLKSGFRFTLAHIIGYLINLAMLIIFVDKMGYPHQWVQFSAIIVVAGFLFVTFKYYVFKEDKL